MKVLDLQCAHEHPFEGWFASEEDFRSQLQRGLVECPMCGDSTITKMLSAPRLNFGAATPARERRAAGAEGAGQPGQSGGNEATQEVVAAPDATVQAAWMKMVRQVMSNTEDVGDRFPEEARRIHYGEAQERGIRGQATMAETEALIEEGIGVLPLPLPKALKGTLQ
ncbi:MAG: DUF1178 family protein [Bdellovibrionales bacterium]|nr:DUF1178 family protein [Ramlibacter sp.]